MPFWHSLQMKFVHDIKHPRIHPPSNMFESFGLAETVFATSAPKTSTGRVSVVTIAQLATQPSATVPSSPQRASRLWKCRWQLASVTASAPDANVNTKVPSSVLVNTPGKWLIHLQPTTYQSTSGQPSYDNCLVEDSPPTPPPRKKNGQNCWHFCNIDTKRISQNHKSVYFEQSCAAIANMQFRR